MSARPFITRNTTALLPLALGLLLAWWILGGALAVGAGEKDVFFGLAALLWSLVYSLAYLVGWWRGADNRARIKYAVIAASLALLAPCVLWCLLWLFQVLKHFIA